MYSHTIKITNGDILQDYDYFVCDKCKELMEVAWPIYYVGNNIHYCPECAFRLGLLSSEEFIDNAGGLSSKMFKAAINTDSGEVEIAFLKSKFSWEMTDRDHRRTSKYVNWRTSVFERDKYTCRICGQKGGELNAHHIKPFKKYKSKRYDIANGITLCKECHKKIHKGELRCPDHKKQE